MKMLLLISGFLTMQTFLFAQSDSITTRDDIQNNFQIKKILVPDFEKLLNFIADKTTAPNEVDEIINNKVNGTKETKIFTDNKVIIENDLKPGADTGKLLRADMDVIQYLNNFNTSYSKSEDKSVAINIINISGLKKTTYFFYTVIYECTYYGTNSEGEKFNKMDRVMEIKLVSDNGTWHPYINSVYFPKGTEADSSSLYKNIIKTETDVDKIMSAYDNDEKKRLREENNHIQLLLDEGDDKFENGDFEVALKKFREARMINIYNKEPQDKISKAKNAIAKKKQKELEDREKEQHVVEMIASTKREQANYNFKRAKLICDSLLTDYHSIDPEIIRMNEELSEINASLSSIENSMEHKNIREVVKICQNKIDEAEAKKKSNIYKAELNFRMALAYFILEKSEEKKIYDYVGKAIDLSGKHHQEALKLRAQLLFKSEDKSKVSFAIEDATQLINNDSRNPDNYIFRAMIFEKDQNTLKAIDDYEKAVLYKTKDSTVFLRKSTLEFNAGKYAEVKKTTSDGISKTSCYGLLYFYHCKACERLKEYGDAGNDFRSAVICGIGEKEKAEIRKISADYTVTGSVALDQLHFQEGINALTKAVLIDSNETALYMRGRCNINLGKNEDAISDLNALIMKNQRYRDAYNQRGIAYTRLGRYKEAGKDFENELSRFNDNASAYYANGISQMLQEDYAPAASSFEHAAALLATDSAYYMASLAYYNNKKYLKAVENSENARKKDTKRFEVFYICGRAYYDLAKYSEAISEFEKAKKLVAFNDNLFFWHAAALEANRQFANASRAWDLLSSSPALKDTGLFRSAVCMIRTRDNDNYQQAINKLIRYNISDNNADKSEAQAWTAYVYLNTGVMDKAEDCITIAKKSNEQLPWLQYVLACMFAKNNKYDEALDCLEKAFAGPKLEKNFYENEPLLKELRKNNASRARYTQLMETSFK